MKVMHQITTTLTWPSTLKSERKLLDVKMSLFKFSINSNINKEAIYKPWGILTLVFEFLVRFFHFFRLQNVSSSELIAVRNAIPILCLSFNTCPFRLPKIFGSKLRWPILRYLHLIHCIFLIQPTLERMCLISDASNSTDLQVVWGISQKWSQINTEAAKLSNNSI